MKNHLIGIALALIFSNVTLAVVQLESPDGNLVVTFDVRDLANAGGCPCYRVDYKGRPVIVDSRLGLEIENAPVDHGLAVIGQTTGWHDTTWKPVCGERAEIRDHYNQVVIELKETAAPHRVLHLTFRAYDEGAAFCYTLPKQAAMEAAYITREHSEFRFREDYTAWATYAGQGPYEKIALSEVKPGCERPLVVQIADDLYAALAEAALVDYARMKFAPLRNTAHSLVSRLDGPVESPLPLTTPWRVVMAADSPGQLLENNFIILNLNAPCAIAETSWIKPGKVIREVSLTTAGGKACVDFAAQHGLQYVEYDAGWYGPEDDNASDATTVTLDPKRSKGPLDLHEVIRYADERGMGIIVYVNHRALERQLDELLPLYKRWGIKGIKFGFVKVGSQKWTTWLHEAIRKAAAHGFMVDVHDEYRPTGYGRTYPNLMTVEGVRGDETRPTNGTTLTYAFTRMLAGYADNTVCWTDRRVVENSTYAYQLAKPVCLFSPWQFLFWYDRPDRIAQTPELEFYRHLPTTWDETKVIHGRIGEYAVIARRKGHQWFIGCMNGPEPHIFDAPLSFLDENRQYVAHIFSDDPAVPTPTHVKVERRPVDSQTVLKVVLPARGGQALRITPAAKQTQ